MIKLKLILALFLIPSLSAAQWFGTDNVSMVKEGTFNNYKQSTIGVALDRWKQCDVGTNWTAFETDNGRNIVEYTCTSLEPKNVASSATRNALLGFDDATIKNVEAQLCLPQNARGLECGVTVEKIINALNPDKPLKFFMQFTINVDDTFDADYIGVELQGVQMDLLDPDVGIGASLDDFLGIIYSNSTFPTAVFEALATFVAME